jgi:hypothetical protein
MFKVFWNLMLRPSLLRIKEALTFSITIVIDLLVV